MKIYTKIILDKNNKILEEEFFEYSGPLTLAGIHYTYGANKNAKLMEKQAKKERRLAEKRAKKQAKAQEKGLVEKVNKEDQSLPLDTVITLDHLTNPDKK
jgi:hypothetical protein|tara:strand:+ start:1716 stop:2015 length:300 start_codon:yes stop_codon:yes gene_type:complete